MRSFGRLHILRQPGVCRSYEPSTRLQGALRLAHVVLIPQWFWDVESVDVISWGLKHANDCDLSTTIGRSPKHAVPGFTTENIWKYSEMITRYPWRRGLGMRTHAQSCAAVVKNCIPS